MQATTTMGPATDLSHTGVWSRAAAACGLLYPLGIFLGDDAINGAGEPPAADAPMTEVKAYLAKAGDAAADGSFWIGRGLGVIGIMGLLVFAVHLARVIRSREGERGMLASLALTGGVAAVGLLLASAVAQFVVVQRVGEGIDLQVARAMLDLQLGLFVIAWLPLAAFLGASATAGVRLEVLPRWLAIGGGVLAVGLVAGLAALPADGGFMAIVLTWLWFAAASIVLVRRIDR
jgi:hypothetical protein